MINEVQVGNGWRYQEKRLGRKQPSMISYWIGETLWLKVQVPINGIATVVLLSATQVPLRLTVLLMLEATSSN